LKPSFMSDIMTSKLRIETETLRELRDKYRYLKILDLKQPAEQKWNNCFQQVFPLNHQGWLSGFATKVLKANMQ